MATPSRRMSFVIAMSVCLLASLPGTRMKTSTSAFQFSPQQHHLHLHVSKTRLAASFKPSSKQQKKVMIDPKTGLYRPIKRVKGSTNNDNSNDDLDSLTQWESAKEVLYKGVDGLSSLSLSIPDIQSLNQKKDDNKSMGVVGGYADIEKQFEAAEESKTPVPFMLRSSADTSPVQKILAVKTMKDKNNNQPLLPPTKLEKLKSFFWKSVDAVQSSQKASSSSTVQSSPSVSASNTMSTTMESFQPAVRARLVDSEEFLQALQDLDSPNPVVRLAAGRKIQDLARRQEKEAELSTTSGAATEGGNAGNRNPLLQAKQSFYQAVDTLQATGESIRALPQRVAKTYETAVDKTQQTIQEVQKVPGKVQKGVNNFQQSIQQTFDATQKTIQSAQAMPGKIQNSIRETNEGIQNKIQETKETAARAQQTLQDVTTQSKVLLGLEKPKPKPPSTPPPEPMTPKQAAWKIAKATGSLLGQATWFIGTNSAKLAWKAGSVAATKGSQVLSTKVKEYQEQQKQPKLQSPKEKLPPSPPVQEPSKKDSETAAPSLDFAAKERQQKQELSALELEIEEALRMADAAIQSAQKEIDEDTKKNMDDDATKE